MNVSVEIWALNPKYTVINIFIRAWNYRVCIGCLTSLLHFSAPRWWYSWCQSWQLNFIYELYSFQTRLFCIIVLEVRSSIGTDWLLRGPILLKSPCHDLHDADLNEQLQGMGCSCSFLILLLLLNILLNQGQCFVGFSIEGDYCWSLWHDSGREQWTFCNKHGWLSSKA
jgi:hypothetical protein